MNLKTSSSKCIVSKAIIKADLKNNWPYMAALFLATFFNFIAVADYGYIDRDATYLFNRFMDDFSFSFVAAGIYGLFLGIKLFGYLHKVNSVSFMHGLPFSRLKLYLSHISSWFILTIIPAGLMTVILGLFNLSSNNLFTPKTTFAFLCVFMIYSFILFSIAAFSSTVCGNLIVSVLFSVFIILAPAALLAFAEYLCQEMLYGFLRNPVSVAIINFLYISPSALVGIKSLVYIIGSLLFILAGSLVYKIRPLENCEEVVSFKKMRMMFIFAVGLVLGMLSFLFFTSIMSTNSLLTMLPLGIVGVIGANMFARKTISFKGSWFYALIYSLAVIALSVSFENGFFGYETRIPDLNDVEYVQIDAGRNFYYHDVEYLEKPDYNLSSPEEIEVVRQLHKAYIDDKNDTSYHSTSIPWNNNSIYRNRYIEITYKLKNGANMIRRYNRLSPEKYEKYAIPLYNLEKMKNATYGFIDEVQKEIFEITIYDDRIQTPAISFKGSDAKKLADALEKDILSLSQEQLIARGSLSVNIDFYGKYLINGKQPNEKEKSMYTTNMNFNINEHFKNTIANLYSLDYPVHDYDAFENIKKISVINTTYKEDVEKYYFEHNISSSLYIPQESYEYSVVAYEEKMGETIYVHDKEHMRKIYEYCGFGFEAGLNVDEALGSRSFVITFFDQYDNPFYTRDFTIIPQNLPEEIQKYFVVAE